MTEIEKKLERLRERLRELAPGGIALAYSGGVDSALLLAVLAELRREKAFPLSALTMRSVVSPQAADGVPADVPHETVFVEPLTVPELRNNAADRCYVCKKIFFGRFTEIARSRGIHTLADGTNADDLGEDRPGLRAARELGVVSPLAELGFRKAEIRAAAHLLGLPCAEKPSAPCLATRFPTGTQITENALRAVAAGEDFLRKFLPSNADLRLRVHGEIARIEVAPENFPKILAARKEIAGTLRALGFKRVALELTDK